MKFTIDEIQALTEKDAKALAISSTVIKEHNVYFADLGEYFGISCLVFKNKHHIYYANDYQLHHRSLETVEALIDFYFEKLNNILFTEDELSDPVSDYDEYKRKEYFLRNYYIMQEDYISWFGIKESRSEKIRRTRWHKDYVSFCSVKSKDFRDKHIKLFEMLEKRKEEMENYYEYQKQAFLSEMYNHEYGINWQADYDTLSAFGNVLYCNELDDMFDSLQFTDTQRRAYVDARAEYYKSANY